MPPRENNGQVGKNGEEPQPSAPSVNSDEYYAAANDKFEPIEFVDDFSKDSETENCYPGLWQEKQEDLKENPK